MTKEKEIELNIVLCAIIVVFVLVLVYMSLTIIHPFNVGEIRIDAIEPNTGMTMFTVYLDDDFNTEELLYIKDISATYQLRGKQYVELIYPEDSCKVIFRMETDKKTGREGYVLWKEIRGHEKEE